MSLSASTYTLCVEVHVAWLLCLTSLLSSIWNPSWKSTVLVCLSPYLFLYCLLVRICLLIVFLFSLDLCFDHCLNFRLRIASPWILLFAGSWSLDCLTTLVLRPGYYCLLALDLRTVWLLFCLEEINIFFQEVFMVCAWFRSTCLTQI